MPETTRKPRYISAKARPGYVACTDDECSDFNGMRHFHEAACVSPGGKSDTQPDLSIATETQLRALVTRLTNVAQDLASSISDPGTEALAAIHCGRHFIYG